MEQTYKPSDSGTMSYWENRLEYLKQTRKTLWNEDYMNFLIKDVWQINKPVTILDCGCGYGALGLLLMHLLPTGSRYTGIDFSQNMIKAAKEIYHDSGFETNFIVSDILKYSSHEKYDMVISQAVLRHVDNGELFLRKMASHVKEGGILISLECNREFEADGLYIQGMDYSKLCQHDGLKKLWQTELKNQNRDYSIAMKIPHYMKSAGLKNISCRMNDKVTFLEPEHSNYEELLESIINADHWNDEKNDAETEQDIAYFMNHGMSRKEAEDYCRQQNGIVRYLKNHVKKGEEGIRTESFFVNRQYKDSLFRFLFKDKKNLLSLYNALNQSSYGNPEDLEIRTIENAIYMGIKNDISFVLDSYIYLYEHQSQDNPNMPLRYLFYLSAQLRATVNNDDLHRREVVRIPVPRFIVFYNGTDERPDYYELKLSDAYEVPDPQPSLELKAQIYNINIGHNTELLETCRILKDYSTYVDMVRRYAREYPIEIAVDKSIEECIQSDVLRDFLVKHRQEAKAMSILEYDYEGHMRIIREEGKEDGYAEGVKDGEARGESKGIALTKKIFKLNASRKTINEIAEECKITEAEVKAILED